MTVFVFNKREMSSATSSLQSRSGTENNPNGYLFLNEPVDGGGGDEINT